MYAKALQTTTKVLQALFAAAAVTALVMFIIEVGPLMLAHNALGLHLTVTTIVTVFLWPRAEEGRSLAEKILAARKKELSVIARISNELRGAIILFSVGMTGYALGIDRLLPGFFMGIGAGLLIAEGVRREKAGEKNAWLSSGF